MRHITQSTIADRIFGIRQDRQGVVVTGFVRRYLADLVILRKHLLGKLRHHATSAGTVVRGVVSSGSSAMMRTPRVMYWPAEGNCRVVVGSERSVGCESLAPALVAVLVNACRLYQPCPAMATTATTALGKRRLRKV